jgi:hypothetical protein
MVRHGIRLAVEARDRRTEGKGLRFLASDYIRPLYDTYLIIELTHSIYF